MHHFIQFLCICCGGKTLNDILAGYIGTKSIQSGTKNHDKYRVAQDVGIKDWLIWSQELVFCPEGVEYGADAAIDVAHQINQGKDNSDNQNRSLNEVCP